MVELTVGDGLLKVEILGWHKLWAVRSRLLSGLRFASVYRQSFRIYHQSSHNLSPVIQDIVARAVVGRLVGALHHHPDSIGAKSA